MKHKILITDDDLSIRTMLQKVLEKEGYSVLTALDGEEGVESALAAMAGDREELANEAADLIFHLLVLLRCQKLELNDVIKVLQQRHK